MRLRLLTLSMFAFAVIGCLPPESAPEGSTTAADTAISCVDTCEEAPVITDPAYNPWAGQAPGYIVPVPSGSGFVLFGYDATLTTPASWRPFVTDCAALKQYLAYSLSCPAALPASCRSQISVQIGQVGGGGLVPIDGNGNDPCKIVCDGPASLAPLAACRATRTVTTPPVTTPPITCHGDCI